MEKSADQFAEGVGFEAAGISFVGVDVDFEFEGGIDPDDQLVEGHAERAVDFELHDIEMFYAVECGIIGIHMNVRLRADDPFIELEIAVGPHQHASGRVGDVSGHFHRDLETEGNGIGVGKLHLIQAAARTKNPEIGNHPAPGTDQRDRFFRSVLAILIEAFHRRQLMAGTEQRLDRLLGEVAMSG